MAEDTARQAHEPVRQCCVCYLHRNKSDFIRLTKAGDSIVIDSTGKNQSRGLYVCPDEKCIHKLIKSGRAKHRFGASYGDDFESSLLAFAEESKPNGNN